MTRRRLARCAPFFPWYEARAMSTPLGEHDGPALIELDGAREAVSVSTLAARSATARGIVPAVGVHGSAGGLAAHALRRATNRPIVYVTHDFETARHAAD